MAYRPNPFLERMSERTSSDQYFVQLFSPKILERLPEDIVKNGVHIFRSAPGAGKTTLFRAFTPLALRAFWNLRHKSEHSESFQSLVAHEVLSDESSPSFLGVVISCASGYADLPPLEQNNGGIFRALFDCRVVLRALRSLALLIDVAPEKFGDIEVNYSQCSGATLKHIPEKGSAKELIGWAEQYEKILYDQLDTLVTSVDSSPQHERFESILWLQSVEFTYEGSVVAPKRMLMIDDMHRLRRKQRELLKDELIVMRPCLPVWISERTVALGEELLSQGVREGRDVDCINLDSIWSTKQFIQFAQNILDRRMIYQDVIASRSFGNCLRGELIPGAQKKEYELGVEKFKEWAERHKNNIRYSNWLSEAEKCCSEPNFDNVLELYLTKILLIRDASRNQLSLDFALPAEEIEERDSPQARAAAELFMHFYLKVPYYYGLDRLCSMATSNVVELLSLAAALYEGLQSMQILRKSEIILPPQEQEKILQKSAQQKWESIPKSHTDGRRAQRLLEAIANLCAQKTYLPNAPYAPGVTGVRLSEKELNSVLPGNNGHLGELGSILARVLAECAAENLLVPRSIAASTNRDSGTVFYLNRTLCVRYNLPLQMGGWQDVSAGDMIKWMEGGTNKSQLNFPEV